LFPLQNPDSSLKTNTGIQYITGYPSNIKLKIEYPLAASTVNIGTAIAAIGWSETVQAQVAQVAQTHCFCLFPLNGGTKKYRLTNIVTWVALALKVGLYQARQVKRIEQLPVSIYLIANSLH
jgi:hypothetical protein